MKCYMEKDKDIEWSYPLSEFTDRIAEGEKEIILCEMKREFGGEMFCWYDFEFVEKGNCGLHCYFYNPCNGVSGRCRHLKHGFVETGKTFRLTNKGLKEI